MSIEIRNAKIASTTLGVEDHGIFTCYLFCEWSGCGCGFGGYALDQYDHTSKERVITAHAAQVIPEIMKVVGVSKWEDIPGKYIRIVETGLGGGIIKIGNLLEDKWFSFKEWFAEEREND